MTFMVASAAEALRGRRRSGELGGESRDGPSSARCGEDCDGTAAAQGVGTELRREVSLRTGETRNRQPREFELAREVDVRGSGPLATAVCERPRARPRAWLHLTTTRAVIWFVAPSFYER